MSVRDHQVLYDEGDQTLVAVPLDSAHRPVVVTSPQCEVVHLPHGTGSSSRTVVTKASVTQDATSTTLGAAAGPGKNGRKLTVADTTGFVAGTHYAVFGDSGTDLVVVEKVDGSTTLWLRYPVTREHASGVTVRGIELPVTFPSATAADETILKQGGGPFGVFWTGEINSEPWSMSTIAWIVRRAELIPLTAPDVLDIDQGIGTAAGDIVDLDKSIRSAAREVSSRLKQVGYPPELHHSDEVVLAAAYFAAYLVRLQMPGDLSERLATAWQSMYTEKIGELIVGAPPHHTVQISNASDTAQHGGDDDYRSPWTLT